MITKISLEKNMSFDEPCPIELNCHERMVILNALADLYKEIPGDSAARQWGKNAIVQLANKICLDNKTYWDDLPYDEFEDPKLDADHYKNGLIMSIVWFVEKECGSNASLL